MTHSAHASFVPALVLCGDLQRLTRRTKFFSKENEDFQEKILGRSGLGDKTYFPTCTQPPRALARKAHKHRAHPIPTPFSSPCTVARPV